MLNTVIIKQLGESMKNLFLITFLIISSLSVQASSGFEVVSDTDEKISLSHVSGLNLILSKERFASEAEAQKFCSFHGAELDTSFNTLLLAVSGVASFESEMGELISFEIPQASVSGIISWAGKGLNTVQMMYDGKAQGMQEVSIEQINIALKHYTNSRDAIMLIPALCIK